MSACGNVCPNGNCDRIAMTELPEIRTGSGPHHWVLNLHELKRVLTVPRASLVCYANSTGSMTVGLVAHTVGIVVLAQTLGAAQFGVLAIITAAANFGLLWCGLGSGELMRRKVARDRSIYRDVLGHTIIIMTATIGTIGVAVAVGLAATVTIRDDFATNFPIMLMFITSNMGMFAWISMTEQILLAHGDMARANLVNISSGAGRAIAAIAACYVWGITELSQWVFWHFGFYLVISIGCTITVARYGRPRLTVMWRDVPRGLTLTASGFFRFLRGNADVLVLGAVASPAIVGVYSVARRIVGTADTVSASLDRIVYSNFAVVGAKGPAATLQLAVRYAAISGLLCAATSIVLFFAAPWIPVLFGEQYSDAVHAARFLAWTLILTSLHNLASDALNAAEQHEMRLAAETTSGLVGAGLMVALTMTYALPGLLISIYLAATLSVVALWSMLIWRAQRQQRAV